MSYSNKLLDHYENPRNVGALDKSDPTVGTGLVGAPACGDVMKLQIKVGADGKIEDAKFKTFGCGSAIASSSLATEWVKGKTLDEAEQIKNTMIAQHLSLPPVKIHCSVLAEDALKAAIKDYRETHGKAPEKHIDHGYRHQHPGERACCGGARRQAEARIASAAGGDQPHRRGRRARQGAARQARQAFCGDPHRRQDQGLLRPQLHAGIRR